MHHVHNNAFFSTQLLLIFLILLQCLPSSQNGAKTHFHSLMWREDSITSRRNSLLCLTVFGRESQSVIWGWVTQDHRWPCASNQQTLEPAGGETSQDKADHTHKRPPSFEMSASGAHHKTCRSRMLNLYDEACLSLHCESGPDIYRGSIMCQQVEMHSS